MCIHCLTVEFVRAMFDDREMSEGDKIILGTFLKCAYECHEPPPDYENDLPAYENTFQLPPGNFGNIPGITLSDF